MKLYELSTSQKPSSAHEEQRSANILESEHSGFFVDSVANVVDELIIIGSPVVVDKDDLAVDVFTSVSVSLRVVGSLSIVTCVAVDATGSSEQNPQDFAQFSSIKL